MTVNKIDIAEKIADNLARSKSESKHIVETLTEIMKRTLESGDSILISGFGKFSVRQKKERKGRNPKTGEDLMLKKRKVVLFNRSDKLKKLLNKDIFYI